jgi:hypothetical protein
MLRISFLGILSGEVTNLMVAPKCGCVLARKDSSIFEALATLAFVREKSSGDFPHARKMACHVLENDEEAGSKKLPMPSSSLMAPTSHKLPSGLCRK